MVTPEAVSVSPRARRGETNSSVESIHNPSLGAVAYYADVGYDRANVVYAQQTVEQTVLDQGILPNRRQPIGELGS